MKYIIALGLIPLSLSALAGDIDYSYCQKSLSPFGDTGFNGQAGFPLTMDKDGKIKAHKDANYKFDKETNTETVSYSFDGYGGGKIEMSTVIKRDENGAPVQFIMNTKSPGMKTKTGLGSGKGFPMGGLGYPGLGGYGGMGLGMGMMGPSKFSTVYDIKIKSGKCFPYRTTSLLEMNGNTHKSFVSDVELCRDVKKMLKAEGTEGSELNRLKACYDKYQDKAGKIISSHLKRNDDLYNPPKEKEDNNPWGSGGYYGDMQNGSFSSGELGEEMESGNYIGGFAGSIDNLIQNNDFTPGEKVKMLSQYCKGSPFFPADDLTGDDSLFVEEKASQTQASDANSSVTDKK